MKILLTVSYDGTNYCGWQRQKNAVTVQQTIEEQGLYTLFKKKITTMGASRTDTGVHALCQKVCFTLDGGELFLPAEKLPYVLNNALPCDIVVTEAQIVGDNFHPIFDAKQKTYEYKILNSPFQNPLLRNYSEHVRCRLDFERMKKAAEHFVGEHDFSAFKASDGSIRTTVRTIFGLEFSRQGELILFRITGNGFLYNMVRIIAGTLIDVGSGKLEPDDIPHIIKSKKRENAGKTAAARGLTLMDVRY